MKNYRKKIYVFFFILIFSKYSFSQNTWILNKELSEINFEVPVFLADNVEGKFTDFEGLVIIDNKNKNNNKALFSVDINSIELNYEKYKDILLSDLFFESYKYPIALIDTKKFTYKDDTNLEINGDLQIKNITNTIPLSLNIIYLSKNMVQIKTKVKFSRKSFSLGKKKWSSTIILKDKIELNTNLFLEKE